MSWYFLRTMFGEEYYVQYGEDLNIALSSADENPEAFIAFETPLLTQTIREPGTVIKTSVIEKTQITPKFDPYAPNDAVVHWNVRDIKFIRKVYWPKEISELDKTIAGIREKRDNDLIEQVEQTDITN